MDYLVPTDYLLIPLLTIGVPLFVRVVVSHIHKLLLKVAILEEKVKKLEEKK